VEERAKLFFSLFLSFLVCKGVLLAPSLAHNALWRVTDFICLSGPIEDGRWPSSPLSFLGHISLWDERRCLEMKINKINSLTGVRSSRREKKRKEEDILFYYSVLEVYPAPSRS